MMATKIETTVRNDGELHLTDLPCRKGDRVEAIILLLDGNPTSAAMDAARHDALARFFARADAANFHSTTPYPSRDELHERD